MAPVTGRARGLPLGLVMVALLAAGVGALSGGAGSPSREGAGAPTAVPELDLRTEQYTLGNGLEVILRRETRLPVVAVNLWYHVGPANEEAGRTGFAHLFEHMMFEGSAHVEEGEGDRLLESAGSSENASTGFDYTNYIVPDVPSNQLELALWLQSDRMGFLLDELDQQNLSTQQAVVRNERRQSFDQAPYGLADEEVYHRLYPPGHPYHASIIGSHADIQAARLDDVRSFFRQFYVPNNASLAIVGDIDVARTKALVERYFGTIPAGAEEVPRRAVPAPPLTAEQRVTMTDTVELPRLTMAWLTPPIFEPGDYDATVASRLLDGTRASRLTRRLVHDLQIAQSVEADLSSLANGSTFTVTATAKPGHSLAELEAAIDDELDDLARRGPARTEVEAAKTAIIADQIRSLDDLGGFDGFADQLNYYNHYLGDPDRIDDDLRSLAAVTPERVRRFTDEHLDPDRRVVIEVAPGPKMPVDDPPEPEQPAAEEPAGEPAGGSAGAAAAEAWRDAVPAPGPAPTTPAPRVEQFTLENGLPVWLVESERLPVVSAALVSRLGSAADPPDRPGLTDLATGLLDTGTTSRDALGLARELESVGATLDNDTGKDGTWLSASSLTGHAADTLAILADVARNPTFPADEVERARDAALVALRQDRDSAGTIASQLAENELYGAGHPYAHPSSGTEAGLRAATVNDLRRAHGQAFTPATTALLLAGDVTPAEARALAGEAFGSWAAPPGPPAAPGAPGAPAGNPEPVLVVDEPGASQTALHLAAPGLRRADPDFEPTLLANRIFGGGFASRLNLNLRETKGYTYGAYSSVGASRGVGLVTISMDVETDATADAVAETLAELDRLSAGVTDDELSRARQWMTGSLATLFDTHTATLDTLRTLYLDELPADYFATRPARLAGLTTGDVAAVARRRLPADAFTVVAVGAREAIEDPLRDLRLGPVSLRSP